MANIFEFLSKDANITPEKARKSRQNSVCLGSSLSMRFFAIEEPGSPVPALYATLMAMYYHLYPFWISAITYIALHRFFFNHHRCLLNDEKMHCKVTFSLCTLKASRSGLVHLERWAAVELSSYWDQAFFCTHCHCQWLSTVSVSLSLS